MQYLPYFDLSILLSLPDDGCGHYLKGSACRLDMPECPPTFYDSGVFYNFILLVEVPMVVVQLSINSCGHLALTKI